MYALRCEKVESIRYSEIMQEEARVFFGCKEHEMLYVLKDKVLYGIITRNDYYYNRENGNILNRQFKCLYSEGKSEDALCREAEKFFARYKTIKELPVVDEAGRFLYVYIRQGEPLDVFPERFKSLYGGNRGFADYVEELKGELSLSADSPEELEQYFKQYACQKSYEIKKGASREGLLEAEDLFREYELELFKRRISCMEEQVFFVELPQQEYLQTLNEDEKQRIQQSSEKTVQFYLRNFDRDVKVQELVKRILEENANKEFVQSNVPSQYVVRDGLCYNMDFNSSYVNVINGRRITTDGPEHSDGEVYMFGPCTMFGMIVEDKYTIPSCLQRLLNERGWSREVVNEGIIGASLLEAIRKFNRSQYRGNDLFVFLIRPGEEAQWLKQIFPEKTIHSLNECFDSFGFHDYFLDKPWHCNKKACNKIAEYMFLLLESALQKGKAQSESVISKAIISWSGSFQKELGHYAQELKQYYHAGNNGAIVMNCNPFTNGHLYLIEQSAKQVDWLYVFVVSEDKSRFPFHDRFRLVREGVKKRCGNVSVIPSGNLILSAGTFPEYFVKETMDEEVVLDTSSDVEIFAKYIAPLLNISVRFAGEEPFDAVTRQYNRDMKRVLPQYGMRFVEIPRKTENQEVISASRVRALLAKGDFEGIKHLVPEVTYRYLTRYHKGQYHTGGRRGKSC